MADKIKPIKKNEIVDELFDEVQDDINDDIKKDAKRKIKDLLKQKVCAEKVLKNIDRQIVDLKLQINHELG